MTRGKARLSITAVTILVGPQEPGPVIRAAQDLQSDLERVLGKKPAIVHRTEDAAAVTILVRERSTLPEPLRPAGLSDPETFSISTTTANWNSNRPTRVVLLAGADLRGTIYAIYEFSEEFLGIDPLYFWTDQQAVRRTRITLPASLMKEFPAPVFKYRGFFINMERIFSELGRYVRAGATEYLVVNTSDIRPAPMTEVAIFPAA